MCALCVSCVCLVRVRVGERGGEGVVEGEIEGERELSRLQYIVAGANILQITMYCRFVCQQGCIDGMVIVSVCLHDVLSVLASAYAFTKEWLIQTRGSTPFVT